MEDMDDDTFYELLQRFNNSRRPTDAESNVEIKNIVNELIDACQQDPLRWKTFVLNLVLKRYHFLSPQAKAEKASNTKECDGEAVSAAGDGERFIFYTAARALWDKRDESENAAAALRVLIRVSPLAGGTRDVCAMIVEFVDAALEQSLQTKRANLKILGEESKSRLVALGLTSLKNMDGALAILCQVAADLLDEDLGIIQSKSNQLPSTLHMFIPHRDRGRGSKQTGASGAVRNVRRMERDRGGRGRGVVRGRGRGRGAEPCGLTSNGLLSDRLVTNAVAEVLIWYRTSRMNSRDDFQSMYQNLLIAASNDDKDSIKRNLHAMQTIIRKNRQELNRFARDRGQMLRNQFDIDPTKVNLSLVKQGKAGDVTALTRVARKKRDSRILQLINYRFTDPSKATRFGSVTELINSWVNESKHSSDEVARLEREIFIARVKATASHLRNVTQEREKSLLVASLDKSKAGHAAAALVAFACSGAKLNDTTEEEMDCKEVRLLIGGVFKDVSSFDSFLVLLEEIVSGSSKNEVDASTFMNDKIATTKAVLNLVDRHLNEKEALLLFSLGDITMPSDVMKNLIAKDCFVHCHDADIIGDRLKREGARRGDITISLAWDTIDDLDLHVDIPSKEHIFYGDRRSRDGLCNLDVDMNAGGNDSKEPVENVFCGDLDEKKMAPTGHYKVVVQNFSYRGSPVGSAIPFRVIIDKNGEKEIFTGECKTSGKESDVVVTEFDYEGRTIPFPISEEERTVFGASGMVNLTASTGQTLDSLGQLVDSLFKLEHLDQVRQLVNEINVDDSSRPEVAEHGTLEVTSRDLLRIKLAKLPQTFHEILGQEFGGGPTLAKECAKEVAERMIAENIPVSELKRNGYPDGIVSLVKQIMSGAC